MVYGLSSYPKSYDHMHKVGSDFKTAIIDFIIGSFLGCNVLQSPDSAGVLSANFRMFSNSL